MEATAIRRRPLRLPADWPRPVFPPTVHRFVDPKHLIGIATQCDRCWGWRDDPRHLTPIPTYDLEP